MNNHLATHILLMIVGVLILLTLGVVHNKVIAIQTQQQKLVEYYKTQADSAISMSHKATLQTRRCISMLNTKTQIQWLQNSSATSSN